MPSTKRNVQLVLAVVCVASALLFARPHATPGPALRDFESYYAAGATWLRGEDPYGTAIWASERQIPGVDPARYELLPFVGPPASLPLWAMFARMPFSLAAIAWSFVLVASFALVVLFALRACGVALTPMAAIAGVAIGLGFGPLTSAIALGQVALPAFAFALIALFAIERTAFGTAVAALFAALQPNVALVLASQAGRLRALGAFAGAALVFAAACAYANGPHALTAYLRVLNDHGAAERFSTIQLTPAAIAYGFGMGRAWSAGIGLAIAAAAVCAWAILSLRADNARRRFAIACAILPFAVPFFHEHDLCIVFVPALAATLGAERRIAPSAIAAALLVAIDWLGLAQRPDGTLQSLLLASGALFGYAALREDLPWRSFALPAASLVLLGIAGASAHAHPAPIWPDAMHALGALPPNASAASVWAAEQTASGLLTPNAFWAALRCLPLAGCVLLLWLNSKSAPRSRTASRVRA